MRALRYAALVLLYCAATLARAQSAPPVVQAIALPPELAAAKNQFSGLFIQHDQLFLLSESRLLDKDHPEGKLYAIGLPDLDRKLTDTAYVLPYRKYHLRELEGLQQKIAAAGQVYEGLEAMTMMGPDVYFSVETATTSPNCYLIKGRLTDSAVVMNPDFLLAIPKPRAADGSSIYNAGFEALTQQGGKLLAFFEYNYFPAGNVARQYDRPDAGAASPVKLLPINKIPFRITDITPTRKNHFTAINYFFRGEDDKVYRPADHDPNRALIQSGGNYRSYCRLIDIKLTGRKVKWKPLLEFPAPLMPYNWEGIAAYKAGYFIINDMYTPQKPYASTLLYLQPAP